MGRIDRLQSINGTSLNIRTKCVYDVPLNDQGHFTNIYIYIHTLMFLYWTCKSLYSYVLQSGLIVFNKHFFSPERC